MRVRRDEREAGNGRIRNGRRENGSEEGEWESLERLLKVLMSIDIYERPIEKPTCA